MGGGWKREPEDGGFPRRRVLPTHPPVHERDDLVRCQVEFDRGDTDHDTDHENEVNEH